MQQVNIINEFDLTVHNFSSSKVIVADTSLLKRLECNKNVVKGNVIGMAKTGVVTSADEIFYLTSEQVTSYKLEKELIYPIIGPSELDRWILHKPETLCLYPYEEIENKTTLIELSKLETKYSGVFNYLQSNKTILTARSQGRRDYSKSNKWYQLNRPREKWIYDSPKLIYPGTTNKPKFAYDEFGQVFRNARVYAYILKPAYSNYYKALMPILNSSLTGYLMLLKCPPKANNYYELSTGFMESFPFILPIGEDKIIFEDISEKIIQLTKDFNYSENRFQKYLLSSFNMEKLSRKLEKWHELGFGDFIKELNKAIKVTNKLRVNDNLEPVAMLTKKDEFEWMDLFEENKKKAQELQTQIVQVENEIDQMVYKLYGLSDDEIQIVENN